jgi:hypothetical protein
LLFHLPWWALRSQPSSAYSIISVASLPATTKS